MANATITAAVAEKTVQENNDAIVRFHLSSQLTSSTTVKASVTPQGGATAEDYGATLWYHMGTGVGGWQVVPNTGVITLNAGYSDFELKTSITDDLFTEAFDSLAFTVAQTTSSVGIADSWWVPSLVNLQDAVGTGTAATTRIITATGRTPGVENSATRAEAVFSMGGSGSTYADTPVRVSMYGIGGATAADYIGNFEYSVNGGGTWLPVPVGGLIDIGRNVATLKLGILARSDGNAETGEGISFNVAQTTSSVGLLDSWWVPNIVDLQDAPGTGASALTRTITAGAKQDGTEGTRASATFNVSGGVTADYAATEVRVSMYGLAGATAADYNSVFQYSLDGGATWPTVLPSGLITIDPSVTSFKLGIMVKSDDFAETGEGISFNVAQTTSSVALVDSWWVQSSVNLLDAPGTGAAAHSRTITAATGSGAVGAGMEGAVVWTPFASSNPAYATFNVSGGGTADYADTTVRVGMFATGGANSADYSGFKYHLGPVGTEGAGWQTVPVGDFLITIGRNDTVFQLASYAVTDSTAETGEGITFTVSQTTSSIGLIDSWWVQSTADLADVAAIYTVSTGAIGPDVFTGTTGVKEMFVIPAGSSRAFADGATGVSGGDIYYTSGQSFDTIHNFATGLDKINLPPAATDTVFSFAATQTATTEVGLLTALQTATVTLGATVIGRYLVGNNAYFLVDTTGGNWDVNNDILIKIVGGIDVVPTDFV
jgi:hypothetical protein